MPEGGSFDEDSDVDDEDDIVVQELLARIETLPEAEEILAKEPDEEDEEAHEEWTAELCMYGEEAFAILEAYEELTEEQQAQISGEAVAKLMAWVELAEVVTGEQETYAIIGNQSGISGEVNWKYNQTAYTLTLEGTGRMADYDTADKAPWSSSDAAAQHFRVLEIGDGVTHIGDYAFAKNWMATATTTHYSGVKIPKTVSSIGKNACSYFKNVIMEGTDIIPELGTDCFKYVETITIPNCEYYDDYCKAPGWSAYKCKIIKNIPQEIQN